MLNPRITCLHRNDKWTVEDTSMSKQQGHSCFNRPEKKEASRCFCLPVTFPDLPFFLFFLGWGSSSESLGSLSP